MLDIITYAPCSLSGPIKTSGFAKVSALIKSQSGSCNYCDNSGNLHSHPLRMAIYRAYRVGLERYVQPSHYDCLRNCKRFQAFQFLGSRFVVIVAATWHCQD